MYFVDDIDQYSWLFSLFRKIRLIQRRIRIHLQANLQRYQFISRYLDYIFPAIFTHVQVIRSDKGHDLRNMTSLDISQIRIQMRTFRAFHMMKEMDTVNFHAFLRKHEGLLSQMTRFFGSSAKNYSTINMEMIKRRVILDLIFQKRYQFMQRLNSFEPVVIPTITFSEQDVKRFIKEGIDPLENFLLEVKKEQDLKYEQYAEALKKSKTNLVPRQYKPGERCLLLIHEIKPEDAATIFLRATDIALHQLSLNRDLNSRMEITGGAGLKSRASQFGEMSGLDLPAEVGGMHEGPGHNNNNASRRNSVLSTGSFNQDASFDGNSSWTAPKRKASIKGNSAHHAIASLNLSSSGAKSVNFGNSSQSSGRRTSVALSKMKMGSPGGLNNSSLASSFKPSAPTSLRKSSVMHSPRANKF